MLKIGLTGGIGSGKTTASHHFEQLGVPIIDTDLIARELVAPGQPCLRKIEAEFGSELIQADGTLDRLGLRALVFQSDEPRKRLEAILHPAIRQVVQQRIQALDGPYCIIVIPLLLERGWEPIVDRVCVVDVPPELQIQRASFRDAADRQNIAAIMRSQVDRATRLKAADDVIDNSNSIDNIASQIAALHKKYLALGAVRSPA